jgi:catechol 2,3-dioxygenase-like lactoylglutathione lyase family enzyme
VAITGLLAQSTVSDLARAEQWYTRVLGSPPDARPMPGLLEWHLAEHYGLQVWSEPQRAGHSSVVLDESDFALLIRHLDDVGIDHEGPQDATSSRILRLLDPDGNRVVFTGPFE